MVLTQHPPERHKPDLVRRLCAYLLYTLLTKPPKFGSSQPEKYPCLERPEKAAAKMTVPTRSRSINPKTTAPTVVKLMPSRVLDTESRRGSRSPKMKGFVQKYRICTQHGMRPAGAGWQ